MSEFDEEAERERLREKYEQDKREREATEKMSELLLQGATMTNAHCSECGDPIFRYDGQEFCPTCERPVDRSGTESDASGEDGGADESGSGSIEVTTPSDDARVAFGDAEESRPENGADAEPAATEADAESPEPDRETSARTDSTRQSDRPARPAEPQQPATSAPESPESAAADPAAAREPLVRTLVRFSERAAATDDPRRARDHLAAAREAAETLAALRY